MRAAAARLRQSARARGRLGERGRERRDVASADGAARQLAHLVLRVHGKESIDLSQVDAEKAHEEKLRTHERQRKEAAERQELERMAQDQVRSELEQAAEAL